MLISKYDPLVIVWKGKRHMAAAHQIPVVPYTFEFSPQHNMYTLGEAIRFQVDYHTPKTVRCRPLSGGTVVTRPQQQMWGFADERVWQQLVVCHQHYQTCLTALAQRLYTFGTYAHMYQTRQTTFGGVRYPFSRWVIEAPLSGAVANVYGNDRRLPTIARHRVTRHTAKMVYGETPRERYFQQQVFLCATEEDWQQIQDDHMSARAAQHTFDLFLQHVPRYRSLTHAA